MSGTVKGTLPKVRDGSEDPQRDPRRVTEHSRRYGTGRGPTLRSETGRGTVKEVLDRSGDPWEGLRRVGRPSRKSWTLPKV